MIKKKFEKKTYAKKKKKEHMLVVVTVDVFSKTYKVSQRLARSTRSGN